MVESRIGELTRKPPTSKEELGGGSLGVYPIDEHQNPPVPFNFALQVFTLRLPWKPTINGRNTHKDRQGRY